MTLDKKGLKEIEKQISATLKKIAKTYGFRAVSCSVYHKNNSYFFNAIHFVQSKENEIFLTMRTTVKLYCYDDILWEIMDMSENSLHKDSLRANGAFAAPVVQMYEKDYSVSDISDIEITCKEAIDEFAKSSDDFIAHIDEEHADFDSFVINRTGVPHDDLIKMIAYIHLQDFSSAKKLAEYELSHKRGGRFRNKGIDVNEFVVRFCDKR